MQVAYTHLLLLSKFSPWQEPTLNVTYAHSLKHVQYRRWIHTQVNKNKCRQWKLTHLKVMLNHEDKSHSSSRCSQQSPPLCLFLPLTSPCSRLTKLSPPVFQTLNSLSITNCVVPPHPSPPLFPFVRHWSLGVQTSAEKHSLSLFGSDERGHAERKRKAEEWQQRQTNREKLRFRQRQNGRRALSIWINLFLCACVFWGLYSLIKTLLDDRGRRQTDSFFLSLCLSLG